MRVAQAASERSEDPHWRVGCCLLRADHTVAALGYNGAPPGVEIDWSDRDGRRASVIHAEANALRYVKPGEVVLMASTLMPCQQCVLLAASYGVKRIIYSEDLDPSVYDRNQILATAAACGISIERMDPTE